MKLFVGQTQQYFDLNFNAKQFITERIAIKYCVLFTWLEFRTVIGQKAGFQVSLMIMMKFNANRQEMNGMRTGQMHDMIQ